VWLCQLCSVNLVLLVNALALAGEPRDPCGEDPSHTAVDATVPVEDCCHAREEYPHSSAS
jgi:hypothetical protein